GTVKPLGSRRIAYAAVTRGRRVRAYRLPGRRPFATFGRVNVNSYPTVFGIVGKVLGRNCRVRWVRAELPMRPNGTFGYLRLADLKLGTVDTRIAIDLSERQLTFYRR